MRKTPLKRKTPMKRVAFKRKPPKPFKSELTANPNQSKKPPKKPFGKRKPKKNAEFYAEWSARHNDCQCCGIPKELAERLRFPGLSTHHIAKAGRVHTSTNIIRLCQRCHDCAEGLDTPVWLPDGRKWYFPKLTFAHCHWLKLTREPKEYDAETLTRLRMGILHEPEPVPAVYQAEWLMRQGRHTEAVAMLKTCDFPGTLFDLAASSMQPK